MTRRICNLTGVKTIQDGAAWLNPLLCTLIAIKLFVLYMYSKNLVFVMDEFTHAYQARYVGEQLYFVIDPIKTALSLLAFYPVQSSGKPAAEVLHLLRGEALLAASVTALGVLIAARRIHANISMALVALFVLLCFSNFMETATNIRGDIFSVAFSVAAFAVFLKKDLTRRNQVVCGLLIGGAFLCTQKSAYHVAALAVGMAIRGWEESPVRGPAAWLTRYLCGAAISVAAYCIGFGGARALEVLKSIFLGPIRMKEHVLTGAAYGDLEKYLQATLQANWGGYLLCAAGVVVAFVSCARTDRRVLAGAVVVSLVTVAIFAHPQPWPYVFVMCQPFLAVCAPFTFLQVRPQWRRQVLAVVTLGLALSFVRNVTALTHDNSAQLAVVREVESLLGPDDRYFDGVGMIPTRTIAGSWPWWRWENPTLLEFGARLSRADDSRLRDILDDRPKAWILNYRLQKVQALRPVLQASTVRISEVVLVSGRVVEPGKTAHFHNLWDGPYRLVDSAARPVSDPIIDGSRCATPCFIPRGDFEIRASEAETVFLLPRDVHPMSPLPVRHSPFDLYAYVYDLDGKGPGRHIAAP